MQTRHPQAGLAVAAWLTVAVACPSPDDDDATVDDDDSAADDDDTSDDDTSDDDTSDDDSADDDDDAGDPLPDWSQCPDASSVVESQSWEGSLSVDDSALYCDFARQYEGLDDVRGGKQMARIVPGAYRFPLEAEAEPWFLPACLWDPDAAVDQATLSQGSVDASTADWLEGPRRTVVGNFPASDGGTLGLTLSMDPEAESIALGSAEPGRFDGGIQMNRCFGKTCFEPEDAFLLPCSLEVNICDQFEFDRGSVALDQHHWAGSVGAGFAALMRARGELDGTAFDVTSYWRLSMTYGHHAFTRGAELLFDTAIGAVCGLRLSEVSEYGAEGGSFETLDCSAEHAVNGTLALESETHTWNQGACEP